MEVIRRRETVFVNKEGKMNIKMVNPATLVPYENNTKAHPPEQVDRIAESIRQFGWQQPIVVDKNNVVIIGHGRLLAAQQLMLENVPVVCAEELTEEQAQALRLADNKTNESPWDFGKLEEELAALSIAGFDMTAFGFAESVDGNDIDSFFDRGVETKEKPQKYGVKVLCETQEQVDELFELLEGEGYTPEKL